MIINSPGKDYPVETIQQAGFQCLENYKGLKFWKGKAFNYEKPWITIEMNLCPNPNESKEGDCKSIEQMEKFLKGKWIDIMVNSYIFDSDRYDDQK